MKRAQVSTVGGMRNGMQGNNYFQKVGSSPGNTMKLKIEEQMKRREEEAKAWLEENGEVESVPEMVQVNVDGDVASVKHVYADAFEAAKPGTNLANMESIQFVD